MNKPIHFEQSISDLEQIVKELERGELSLEDSLKQFEKGIGMARKCQELLSQAEQKIQVLTSQGANLQSPTDDMTRD